MPEADQLIKGLMMSENVPSCGAFAFFKLYHRVGGGVRGAHRHGLVPASERLCILSP